LLHDKKSPQSVTGDEWRDKLFKIVEPSNVQKVMKIFNDRKIGIVGAREFLLNEYDSKENVFRTTNHHNLTELVKRYSLSVRNYSFIGGTIFWVRQIILQKFFAVNKALECRRELEYGNVQDIERGSVTHTWERLLCWIATSQEYKIKGV
jgi:lipopolysaccharide biosynthesis protein